VAFALTLSGCAGSGYWADRGRDAADIASLTAGAGLGAMARVGPIYLNAFGISYHDHLGWRGGGQDSDIGSWFAFGQTWTDPAPEGRDRGKQFHLAETEVPFVMIPSEGSRLAFFTQFEVSLGLLLGARFGLNPVELLDFLLGWTTLDFFGDDLGPAEEPPPDGL
jgi:hypothetical protein